MREIRFRGKSIRDGKWIYGWYFLDDSGHSDAHYIKNMKTLDDEEVNPETVGQFTGLNDRNGKGIFEGDVIKQEYHVERGSYEDIETFDGHHIGEVTIIASKGVCMRKPVCYSSDTDEWTKTNQYKSVARYRCEVIGNTYDNSDLLCLGKQPDGS